MVQPPCTQARNPSVAHPVQCIPSYHPPPLLQQALHLGPLVSSLVAATAVVGWQRL